MKKDEQRNDKGDIKIYLRFGAMILTAMVVMYWTMFISSWEFSHIRFSQSRIFMTFTMGGTMGLIMLSWMLNMYRNTKANVVIILLSFILFGAGVVFDRSQITVNDIAFMRGMIPHHSLAITRSERSQINDVRVCNLTYDISEAQRREILEMEWLINDIKNNGLAVNPVDAASRPIPEFEVSPIRSCP